jgi:hypothetical protein
MLAAIDPATHFTDMPPPSAKLCRHPVQRYAATKLLADEVVKISSTPKACSGKTKLLKTPYCVQNRWGAH